MPSHNHGERAAPFNPQAVTMDENLLNIDRECRRILKSPSYSKQQCAQLIDWLRLPNAALSDIAGKCLMKLGSPAFDDLLEVVLASVPWPNAIWVLSALSPTSEKLLPLLRAWLTVGDAEVEAQSALCLAAALIAQKQAGREPESADVAACLQIMERDASTNPAMRLHLREFGSGLALG